MRKISANYIFDGKGNFYKNGILIFDEKTGEIIELIDTKGELKEENKLEFYNGIISPGFVNAHCHIELSSLKNKINEKTKLPGFIKQILSKNQNLEIEDIEIADKLMQNQGIVAVGDVSNTDKSFNVKQKSKIKYHTFIEIYSPDKNRAYDAFEKAENLKQKAELFNLKSSIVPHAPYSVSEKLLKLITEKAYSENAVISFHNQETESENEMFVESRGGLLETLKEINPFYENFKPTYFNSLASTLVNLPKCNKTILVHNTFSTQKDIDWVKNYTKYAYWCMCPNANTYIENEFPDIELFEKNNLKICIGTDSFASNKSLSILDEIKLISQSFDIELDRLLTWATYNGAEALDLQDKYGSFEKRKIPGIVLIENVDVQNLKLKNNSFVKNLY